MAKISSDKLWELAAAEVQSVENGGAEEGGGEAVGERTVFLMGSKAGGKTSILLRCLDRDEPAKPTLALEYTFGRRATGHNTPKDIAHLWELGGGTSLSDLVQISITPASIRSLSVILVLDLSSPNALWGTMEKLMQAAQVQVEKAASQVMQDEKSRAGSKHQTSVSSATRVLPKDYPFTSIKSESQMSKTKSFFSRLAFNVETSKTISCDSSKPLIIPAGADSFSQIGSPPSTNVDIASLHARNPKDLWKKVFEHIFPPESLSEQKELKDPAKDPQYSEPQIDAMRAQKDQELEEYKKNAAKSWKGLELDT
ncbi:cytoplasmic dynein 2 light intermediate chain 1 isoform X2 [Entelurus aequoreus]|uniref:cytoplasmic dynein 2 light intermediate chain 1 isoform X2 n=1 Tax=Entelurus aequoreus TaxID=161455 RepID=UPI002B1D3C78|nr:cytoplasmic dynein 2 light intermediate chain 1 isoform X2 [Entelurus aequoreus]